MVPANGLKRPFVLVALPRTIFCLPQFNPPLRPRIGFLYVGLSFAPEPLGLSPSARFRLDRLMIDYHLK